MNTTTRPAGVGWSAPGYRALAGAGALVMLVMLVRLAVFAQAPAPLPASAWSVTPWNAFITRHACATAYWKAATVIDRTPDVYHPSMYESGTQVEGRSVPQFIGPFAVDPYEYPPTFLLLPRLLTWVTPDFPSFRLLWGFLATVVTLLGVAVIAKRVDAANGTRSLWLMPLAILPIGVLTTFQGGNAQLFFVVLAMLAMLAFERRQDAIGGLLLGYATVGKLFPGLLLVYLLARREWRPAAWTAGWSLVLSAIAIADFGWAPFAAFLDHVPKLLSGEAFPMLRFVGPSDVSLSIPGLVLKLRHLGLDVPFAAMKTAGWIYSAIILWITIRLARHPVAPRLAPLAWLVVLGLAAFRSPFLPGYGIFQGAWMAALLLALCWQDAGRRWLLLALWASLLWATAGPLSIPPVVVAAATTAQIAATLVLFGLAVRIGRQAAVALPAGAAA
jgi:hypothetical protein